MRLIGLLTALLLPSYLHAGSSGNPLEIELISESRGIMAGKPISLGLRLAHPAGTHTYWKNPGIVGVGTTVQWDLPPGFHAGEIQWPAPRIVKMAGHEAQGYTGETLLMIQVTPPPFLADEAVTLTAKVSWMCCGKICSPAVSIPFSITLPVTRQVEVAAAAQPLFEKYRALIPRHDPAWRTHVKREGKYILLTLVPPSSVQDPGDIHFFTADGQVDSSQKQAVEIRPDGTIRMMLTPAETGPQHAATLPGVVSFSNGTLPFHLEIEPGY